ILSQVATVCVQRATLEAVVNDILQQVSYQLVMEAGVWERATPVTTCFREKPVGEALTLVFRGQPLGFELQDGYVRIRYKHAGAAEHKGLQPPATTIVSGGRNPKPPSRIQ